MLDQAAALRALVKEKKENQKVETRNARIITISSGKGGVGKSNVVVNLGITLQKMGKKVLIFDADIGMGNDDIILGIYPKHNIYDVVLGKVTIKDSIIKGSEGISLLAGGSALNKIEEFTTVQRESFISNLKELNDFDYILMDTGAGVSRTVLGFIAACDDVILVTTPEPTALTDAYSLIKAVSHFKLKNNANVIVNRSYTHDEGLETFNKFAHAAQKFIGFELLYLGFIYDDKKLEQAVRMQKPVTISFPKADSSKCIKKIAQNIINNDSGNNIKGADGFFRRLFDLFS